MLLRLLLARKGHHPGTERRADGQENPEHREHAVCDSPRHHLPPVLRECSSDGDYSKRGAGPLSSACRISGNSGPGRDDNRYSWRGGAAFDSSVGSRALRSISGPQPEDLLTSCGSTLKGAASA